jgi:hypothetical protein
MPLKEKSMGTAELFSGKNSKFSLTLYSKPKK